MTMLIVVSQFIKAMRQSDGSVMANAHLLGMFRRLCKLIFMKVSCLLCFCMLCHVRQ